MLTWLRGCNCDFPLEHINSKAPHTPYSFWHFVEHIRIAQWDILEFIREPASRITEIPGRISSRAG